MDIGMGSGERCRNRLPLCRRPTKDRKTRNRKQGLHIDVIIRERPIRSSHIAIIPEKGWFAAA